MRIVLVDDHEIVRQGIRGILESQDDMEVVGEAGTVEEAIRRVGFDVPDVVVCDVRLPDGSGVEACREIRSRWPQIKVLMLTSYADEEALMAAIMAGASGYVLKRIDTEALLSNIRTVAAGGSLLDEAMTEKLFRKLRGDDPGDPMLARLTPQESKILFHIADGLTNRQIAEEMFLAEKTVKNYVSNLLSKLEMSRRSEAAAYAARLAAKQEQVYPPEEWDQ